MTEWNPEPDHERMAASERAIAEGRTRPLRELIQELKNKGDKPATTTLLVVSKEGCSVELYVEPGVDDWSEWIRGEGAHITLHRSQETNCVVGVRLPIKSEHLTMLHAGPLVVNDQDIPALRAEVERLRKENANLRTTNNILERAIQWCRGRLAEQAQEIRRQVEAMDVRGLADHSED